MVAKATEPSWTPIFTNASGVIMEVSGLLGIMDILNDGDLVELDGSSGIVRILEKAGR